MNNKLLREIIIIAVCLILGYAISRFILTNIRDSEYNVRVYNCDLAEISPDFPLKAKEQCRKLKHENSTSQRPTLRI